jgi:hypothetical protein
MEFSEFFSRLRVEFLALDSPAAASSASTLRQQVGRGQTSLCPVQSPLIQTRRRIGAKVTSSARGFVSADALTVSTNIPLQFRRKRQGVFAYFFRVAVQLRTTVIGIGEASVGTDSKNRRPSAATT